MLTIIIILIVMRYFMGPKTRFKLFKKLLKYKFVRKAVTKLRQREQSKKKKSLPLEKYSN